MSDETQAMLLGFVRHLLTVAGTMFAAGGINLSGTQLDNLAGGIVALAVVGWSMWQKRTAAVASRQIAVASAVATFEKGTPVTVEVTPVGEPNVATKISATEIAAAPAVPTLQQPMPAPVTP